MAEDTPKTPWIHRPRPKPEARMRLFCAAHAGGGASTFVRWGREVPDTLEVCGIQLPGHEERFREPCITRLEDLLPPLIEGISLYLDRPFAFFGHSLGARIGFELMRELQEQINKTPVHFFASSARAPHIPAKTPHLHPMSDEDFLQTMQQRYGGIPAAVQQEAELLELFLPIMRADMELLETRIVQPGPPLRCPITVFSGDQDPGVQREMLEAWHQHTQAAFHLEFFEGGHFYLNDHRPKLLNMITKALGLS